MSYLNALRLHFSGRFQANVSTVNNDPGHFDNAGFQSSYQQMQSATALNGWFNPQGDAVWRLLGCRVTSAWTSAGEAAASDPVLACRVADSDSRAPAKLVDLDPEQQLVSEIWGLQVRIADANGNTLLCGNFEPAAFTDIWDRATASAGGDTIAGAMYQSVLSGLEWGDVSSSAFLTQLNAGPNEVVPGVRFMTIRSDKLDKYAQPNIGYDGPALKGAENIEIPNLDHREVAFHPLAFAQMYRFLTGQTPKKLKPAAQTGVSIGGVITGFEGMAPTNRPIAGVRFRIFALQPGSAERDGEPVLDMKTTENGTWGPLATKPDRQYEFLLEKEGRTLSYFMAAIPRSTSLLNFRFVPKASAQLTNGENLLVHRPQGYLAKGRDPITLDGEIVEDLLPGIPTRDSAGLQIPDAKKQGVRVTLRDEAIYARPAISDTGLNIVELIWE